MPRKTRLTAAFEPADALIGIVTELPPVKLVHFINCNTILRLSCTDDLEIYFEKPDELAPFRFFYCRDDEFRSDFCLIPNASEGQLLLPKIKEVNYLLIIRGAIPDEVISRLITSIRQIAGVRMASLVNQKPMPELGPILQEIELHLIGIVRKMQNARMRIMPPAEDQ